MPRLSDTGPHLLNLSLFDFFIGCAVMALKKDSIPNREIAIDACDLAEEVLQERMKRLYPERHY